MYGDELGITDVVVPPERGSNPARIDGPIATRAGPAALVAGPAGGFTTGAPWLPSPADEPQRPSTRNGTTLIDADARIDD